MQNPIIDYDSADMVITAAASTTVGQLNSYLKPYQQRLGVTLPSETTLSKWVLAELTTLESGLKRSMKERVLGLSWQMPHGEITKAGGKVVKNVTGYDLQKFYLGNSMALGSLATLTLRTEKRPKACQWVLIEASNWQEALSIEKLALSKPSKVLSAFCLFKVNANQVFPLTSLLVNQAPSSEGWFFALRLEGEAELFTSFLNRLEPLTKSFSPVDESDYPQLESFLTSQAHQSLSLEAIVPFSKTIMALKSMVFNSNPDKFLAQPACGSIQLSWKLLPKGLDEIEMLKNQLNQWIEEIKKLNGFVRVIFDELGHFENQQPTSNTGFEKLKSLESLLVNAYTNNNSYNALKAGK